MRREALVEFDATSLQDAVGPTAYGEAVHYVRQHAVVQALWNAEAEALVGTVRGNGGNVYTTTASFTPERNAYAFDYGECSCPVGIDCKHVAALLLAALGGEQRGGERRGAGNAQSRQPAWDTYLGSLLESDPAGTASGRGQTPLAIELTLSGAAGPARARGTAAGSAPRLNARLVQPGKRENWISGDLSWTKLGMLQYYGNYIDAHIRLLQEFYAIYRSRGSIAGYYHYQDEKFIELSTFPSRQLWPLLDEADAIGVRLVYARNRHGAVTHDGSAELCLDVTRSAEAGALAVTPATRVDGSESDVVPIRFIGTEGHGLVYADREGAEACADLGALRFRLAKLDRAAPSQVQRMVLEGRTLEIPTTEENRFRDEYYPRLRRLATVISSDGSFTPPEISEPTLVLRADYHGEHDLDMSWEWAYQVGDSQYRAPLKASPSDAGYRDPAAERAVLAALDAPLEEFGLRDSDPLLGSPERATLGHARLGGIDTMRASTELLPLLADEPDVAVEVSGDPADYREAGDSLRIGVSTDDAGETDWFDLGITITVEEREVPFETVFTALARDESYLLLADGAYFSLEKPELQSLRRLIEEARALQDATTGSLKISRFQAGLWDELAALGVVDRQATAWQRQVQPLLSLESIGPQQVPEALHAQLRPYQVDGFSWLGFLWEYQLGGILADDMGLGKTLQALALISHAKRTDPDCSPFLIVAPASVVSNWVVEAGRFTPELNVVSISETLRRGGNTVDGIVANADVVVISYTLFRLDFEDYSETPWSGLVLDEAQFAKNHQSKIYQCARRLPAPFKLAITGTPMENNLMELWSLLSITAPGLFPNPTRFRDYYARPIEKGGDAELLAQLRRRVKPLIKRRTKEQVAGELPPKQEQVLEVELHSRHRKVYQTHLQRERQKVLGLLNDMDRNRFTILRSLTLLRQLSLHAGLVDEKHTALPCAKIDALLDQVRDVSAGGHRALVFSQFTGFLEQVRERLDDAGIEYCYLDGKTRNRATIIKRFKDGSAPVFLISLKAGGFGLNLTEADYCFLLDPWWNPATETQAVDRTHRIGQSRNVMVYRLIAKDTIEEKVMALKERKAALFSSVMDEGDAFGTSLAADDIKELFA